MNRRPRLLTTAVAAAAAALLLTACGGGGESKDNDKIAGADTGGEKSASPSASVSDSAERPKIELPSDLTHTFTPKQSDDAVQNAVLKDNAELIRALGAAIVAQNPRLPALEALGHRVRCLGPTGCPKVANWSGAARGGVRFQGAYQGTHAVAGGREDDLRFVAFAEVDGSGGGGGDVDAVRTVAAVRGLLPVDGGHGWSLSDVPDEAVDEVA